MRGVDCRSTTDKIKSLFPAPFGSIPKGALFMLINREVDRVVDMLSALEGIDGGDLHLIGYFGGMGVFIIFNKLEENVSNR